MIIIILVFISEELMTELQKPSDAKEDSTQAPSIVCNQETFNDGICDEENNNESCGFDGGDCCEFHDLWDSRCKSQGKVSNKQGLSIHKVCFFPLCMHLFYYHPWRSD